MKKLLYGYMVESDQQYTVVYDSSGYEVHCYGVFNSFNKEEDE